MKRIGHAASAVLASLAFGVPLALAGAAQSPGADIVIPGTHLTPESLTSTADGSVIIGSIGAKAIFRARPGATTAEQWIAPGTGGLYEVFGVLADDASGTLWACSSPNDDSDKNAPPPALHAFDLQTGAPKGHWPLPTAKAFCNDIAVGPDGSAYVSDSNNMEVLRLPAKGKALEVWAGNGAFGPKGGVLDGIAVVDGHVLVNALETGKLFSVPIGKDGKAGTAREVKLDRALKSPDGQRSFGRRGLLVVEAGDKGRLSRVELSGPDLTQGRVTTVKEGFPDDAAGVTVVGETAYVIGAQWGSREREKEPGYEASPFKATAVPVGKPH